MTGEEKLAALNQILEHCRTAPFYKNRIPDRPLNSLEEFKEIPLTTKEELRENSPFGLICVPQKELYQYHESFGTSGIPVSTWVTKEDLRRYAKNINSGGLKFSKEDTVLIRFPYAISSIAHMVHAAAQAKKACVIAASSRSTVSPFPRIIDLMQKLEVTVLAGLPLQAFLLAETAELMGYAPLKDFPKLRAIFTAGEPLTSSKRNLLESIWGVPIIDNFGMTEIGSALTDCKFARAHPTGGDFIFEILEDDLKTETKLGEVGNLVITTLKRKATPVIRYLTGDRARIVPEECGCGQKFTFKHHGRKKDVIKVGNRVLDIWDFDEIVAHFPCRRFWVVGPIQAGLKFVIEEENPGDSISNGLITELEDKYGLKLEVEIVPKGALYDRDELFVVSQVGKPRYIYSTQELKEKAYLQSANT